MLNNCKTVFNKNPNVSRKLVQYNCISYNGILDNHSKEGGRPICLTGNDVQWKKEVAKQYVVIHNFWQSIKLFPSSASLLSLTVWPSQNFLGTLEVPSPFPFNKYESLYSSQKTPPAVLSCPSQPGHTLSRRLGSPHQSLTRWYLSSASPNTSFLPVKSPFFSAVKSQFKYNFFQENFLVMTCETSDRCQSPLKIYIQYCSILELLVQER